MTERPETEVPRRILVALEGDEGAAALLEAVASLAAGLHAELVGLFVEDIALLDAAGLPVARFLPSHAQAHAALDAAMMQRALRISASKAGAALAAAAESRRVKWSFRVVRGTMQDLVLAEVQTHDLLALGASGRAVRRARHAVATRVVAQQAPCSVLLLSTARADERPVTVLYDGSQRALVTGERLARIYGRPLLVVALGESDEAAQALETRACDWIEQQGARGQVRRRAVSEAEEICEALRAQHPGVLVVDPEGELVRRFGLESLLGELRCSVLVLR